MTVVPDPIEQADLSAIINRLLDRAADIENIARAGVSVHQRPSDAQLLRLAATDLSRLRETNAERQSIVGELMEQRDEAEALASRLREERDALTHDRDQARDEADNWRQQAWMEGYPRDSGDRHPWETSDEYRDLLAAGWASPTPRISPEATS